MSQPPLEALLAEGSLAGQAGDFEQAIALIGKEIPVGAVEMERIAGESRAVMYEHVGLVRDADGLLRAARTLRRFARDLETLETVSAETADPAQVRAWGETRDAALRLPESATLALTVRLDRLDAPKRLVAPLTANTFALLTGLSTGTFYFVGVNPISAAGVSGAFVYLGSTATTVAPSCANRPPPGCR